MEVPTVRSRKLFWIFVAMFYGLKVIGLAPVSVETATTYPAFAGTGQIRVFKYSKSGFIYNVLLAFAIFAVDGVILPNFLPKANVIGASTNSVLIDLVMKMCRILYIFAYCISVITWTVRQRKAASILNRLLEIGVRLSGWKNPPLEKKSFVFMIVHLIINAHIWVSFWVLQLMHVNIRRVIITFAIYLPIFITYFFIVEYFVVVGLIARGIENVNNSLIDLTIRWNGNRRRNSQLSIIYFASDRRDQLASLRVLKSVRMTLSELCDDVEVFFSLPILFSIGSAFVPLSTLLYRYIVNAYSPKNNVVGVSSLAAFTFTMIFICLYPLTSLTFNVTKTIQEAKRTKRIINKLLADDKLMTQEIEAELELFYRCLADESPDFTAFGLFTLDSPLLLSVLGTTTTYLIILIQFWSSGMDKN